MCGCDHGRCDLLGSRRFEGVAYYMALFDEVRCLYMRMCVCMRVVLCWVGLMHDRIVHNDTTFPAASARLRRRRGWRPRVGVGGGGGARF